mgnify:CR=1 FL=1
MTYYHLLIVTYEFGKRYYELDKIDLSEIKEEIVIPFLKGERFMFDGYFFEKAEVERILIRESAYTSQMYADILDKVYPDYPISFKREDIVSDEDKYTTDITRRIFRECQSLIQEATTKSEAPTPNNPKAPMDKSKVFIVHGHDNAAKEAVARFVEKIGLEAIILHEQASSGNTIIEKIEANSNVGFAIVLYTPCDLGASKEEKDQLKPRARQNVIFEHGYLIGKIGRKNVCHLFKSGVETPSDIEGLVYAPMDAGDGWKYTVAKEMKACGYDVDLNKI